MKDKVAPWTIEAVDEETNRKLLKLFRGERDGFIQVGPEKYIFPWKFDSDAPKYYGFQPRTSDVWVMTFPRSGTTLTQELVWLLGNNFDFEAASRVPLYERFPFFEFGSCVHPKIKEEFSEFVNRDAEKIASLDEASRNYADSLEKTNGRRFIKTHFPFSLLNPKLTTCGAKMIYIARNPKDVAVSYYHLTRLFRTMDFVGTFEEFWEVFEQGQIQWCPYWKHINEGWLQRNNPNVLFLFYEDILQDMPTAIRQISSFLGTQADENQIQALANHLHISNFKNNSSVNYEGLRKLGFLNDRGQKFVRKGAEKGGQAEFTEELEKRANIWIEDNLRKTTLRFPREA